MFCIIRLQANLPIFIPSEIILFRVMGNVNVDEQFGLDSDPITREMIPNALQLAESMAESEGSPETRAALELLQIDEDHLRSLKKRINAVENGKRIKLTLGDHMLLYTSYYLFTKFY